MHKKLLDFLEQVIRELVTAQEDMPTKNTGCPPASHQLPRDSTQEMPFSNTEETRLPSVNCDNVANGAGIGGAKLGRRSLAMTRGRGPQGCG